MKAMGKLLVFVPLALCCTETLQPGMAEKAEDGKWHFGFAKRQILPDPVGE